MKLYRLATDGMREELEPAESIIEAVPIDEEMGWAYTITNDDAQAEWLAEAKRNNLLGGYDDESIREMLKEYSESEITKPLSSMAGIDDLARYLEESPDDITQTNRDETTAVAKNILNNAVDAGIVSHNTAKTVSNSNAGVIPIGSITPTGRKKRYDDEESSDGFTHRRHIEEISDDMGYTFVKTHTETLKPDGSTLTESEGIMSLSSDNTGVQVSFEDTTRELRGKNSWMISLSCNAPSKAEMRILERVRDIIDAEFAEGISIFDRLDAEFHRPGSGHKKSPYDDPRHVRRTHGSNHISWQGDGPVPDITRKIMELGDIEGAELRIFGQNEISPGVHQGFSVFVAPTFEDGREDYNDMLVTLSKIKDDGSAVGIIDAFPKAVHTMVHRGKLAIWDSEEKWDEYGKPGTLALIISSYGGRKFRIMVRPDLDTKGTQKAQALCHEMGHFIFDYMVSGSDPWEYNESIGKSEKSMHEDWKEWYYSTGIRADDMANDFVQSEYPETKWYTEYFAEVASVILMGMMPISGELSGEKPAIDPTSYQMVKEIIGSQVSISKNSGFRPSKYYTRYNRDTDTETVSSTDKIADYGNLIEAPKDALRRPMIGNQTNTVV
jgi:hypothetical protein